MRRRFEAFIIAVTVVAMAGVAQAMTFDPTRSRIQVAIFSVNNPPPLTAAEAGGGGSVILVDDGMGGHNLMIQGSVWATVNYGQSTSLYTGVPIVTDVGMTLTNNPLTATSSFTAVNFLSGWGGAHLTVGPCLGGQAGLSGNIFLMWQGLRVLDFPLSPVGATAGGTFNTTVVGVPFTITYMPWFTGPVPITGITTNLLLSVNGATGVAITRRWTPGQIKAQLCYHEGIVQDCYWSGGTPVALHTVTLSGQNILVSAASTISGTGRVTLVSPMRINTSPSVVGRLPGAVWMDLVFVPEPGQLLVLLTGAVGLAAIGRRRARARR